MWLLLCATMVCLLLRPAVTMSAASDACRLFVTSVMPGLLPYMVLSQMLISRVRHFSPLIILLLGWGGGSPTGARLLRLLPGLPRKDALRLAVSCATMSPMFLLGTIGQWLGASKAGWAVLAGVITGGWLTGLLTSIPLFSRRTGKGNPLSVADRPLQPLSFGASIESAARTMLLVCGTMVMLRVYSALASDMLPAAMHLPVTTLLEVTTGTAALAALPLPLPFRSALIAGAAGFGGLAILLQNRAVIGEGFMPLPQQLLWQVLHGGLSFLITLGLMCFLC